MKQILQNLRSGKTTINEVPAPAPDKNRLLIHTRKTLISAGTEKMLVEFGQASLIGKAKAQPEKVRQVLDKIRSDGLLPTIEMVFNQLDEPLPLGYCNAGTVLEVGEQVIGFKPGDRVVSNGPHAELVSVPPLLCEKIPENVSDEHAAFTVLASIGLQGIRLAKPGLGETIVVYGLGLIGLITVQLLAANGCNVIGIDINKERMALAEQFGVKTVDAKGGVNLVTAVYSLTKGRGADAVIITASAKGNEIIHQSAQISRKRGRIVSVGVVGMNLNRADFYEKELRFQVSCSYGPGRYDDAYEQEGNDYPIGFVRWTEQRNFEAVLDMLSTQRLKLDSLITHRIPIGKADQAYKTIQKNSSALGVILDYPAVADQSRTVTVTSSPLKTHGKAVVGIIGAGNFAKMTLVPTLSKTSVRIEYIAARSGSSVQHLAEKYKITQAVTDYKIMLDDPKLSAVIIAVGHDLHARLICEALAAGKHVFVEKPLALNTNEVMEVLKAMDNAPKNYLMVGFNRRFSAHIMKMKSLLKGRSEPLAMNYTVNAGYIPKHVWVQDTVRAGGRIIGEACHFIDLMVWLTDSLVCSVAAQKMGGSVSVKEDKMAISLGFEDGSVGTINYFANGSKNYPKEQLEVFSDQRILKLDNFRKTSGYEFDGFKNFKTTRPDKGHREQFAAFIKIIEEGGNSIIPIEQIVNVSLASFAAEAAADDKRTIDLEKRYSRVIEQLSRLYESY
ncbi:MAG: Gfo/Idh/MocA family oxidoreductase [Desulfobacteraceae bacterium]|nr:Gfo/Idh/MocA family oxidoreductase [Desulfobacteraceae bacterium]